MLTPSGACSTSGNPRMESHNPLNCVEAPGWTNQRGCRQIGSEVCFLRDASPAPSISRLTTRLFAASQLVLPCHFSTNFPTNSSLASLQKSILRVTPPPLPPTTLHSASRHFSCVQSFRKTGYTFLSRGDCPRPPQTGTCRGKSGSYYI